MITATSRTVTTATTYAIPANTLLIEDATSPAQIRPTTVTVTETDGEITTFTFHGPRRRGTQDMRDNGSRVIGAGELDLGDSTEEILNEVLMLHLRSTVKVLTEDETRAVLAKLA
jgi:hypothetical protein